MADTVFTPEDFATPQPVPQQTAAPFVQNKDGSFSNGQGVSATPIPVGQDTVFTPDDFNHYHADNAPPTSTTPVKQKGNKPVNWSDLPSNFKDSAFNFAKGVGDALVHLPTTIGTMGSVAVGAPLSVGEMVGGLAAGGSMTPEIQSSLMKNDPFLQGMVDKANTVGGVYKNRYGTLADIKKTIVTDPVGFAADLSSLLAGGAGAARAAGMDGVAGIANKAASIANPVTVVPNTLKFATDATGLTPHIADAAGKIADAFIGPQNIRPTNFNPLDGFGIRPLAVGPTQMAQNRLMTNIAEDPAAMQNALRNAQTVVPNSSPTAVQGIKPDFNSTSWDAAGAQAAKNTTTATAFDNIHAQQSDAQLAHVYQMGRDPVENIAAFGSPVTDSATANNIANAQYNAAKSVYGPIVSRSDATLRDILDNTLAQRAVSNTRAAMGPDYQIGSNVPAHEVPDPYGQNLPPTQVPEQFASHSGTALQQLKEHMDALIYGKGDASAPALTAGDRSVLLDRRNRLVQWIANNNQPWNDARTTYATQKGIINRMDASDALSAQLNNPLTANDTTNLRSAGYGSALNSDSFGRKGDQSLQDVVTTDELNRANAVRDDLARQALARQGAINGGESAQNIKNAASDAMLPHILNTGHGVLNSLGHLLTGSADQTIYNNVSRGFQTPEAANALLTDAINRRAQMFQYGTGMNALLQGLTRQPAVYNVNQDAQKKNALVR